MKIAKKFFVGLCAALTGFVSQVADAEEFNLNADWRFSWANDTIPLANAMKSVEKGSIPFNVANYDDSDWQLVSVPHPVNAHDSFDNHARSLPSILRRKARHFLHSRPCARPYTSG